MPRGKPYSKEFKLEAIGRALEGTRSDTEVARELGISVALLSRWKNDYLAGSPKGTAPAVPLPETEVKRLRQEVARLRQERDFLKKAVSFFARESS
jgi:transposase